MRLFPLFASTERGIKGVSTCEKNHHHPPVEAGQALQGVDPDELSGCTHVIKKAETLHATSLQYISIDKYYQ